MRFTFQFEYPSGHAVVGEKLKTPGVDFGPKGLKVVYRSACFNPPLSEGLDEYILVVRGGHTGWSGVGSTSYYPASYRILRVYTYACSARKSVTGKAWTSIMAEEVVEEEPGSKWRECVKRLSDRCDELQAAAKVRR